MKAEVDKFVKASKQWQKEIAALREVILETKLDEGLFLAQNKPSLVSPGSKNAFRAF